MRTNAVKQQKKNKKMSKQIIQTEALNTINNDNKTESLIGL